MFTLLGFQWQGMKSSKGPKIPYKIQLFFITQTPLLVITLTYLNNNGKELSEYLNDGRLEISNNLAERSIKPFVIDRKNFLFANTPKGAKARAVTFSLIQTAIANGLDPYKYLRYVFTEAPKIAATGADWINVLLPENAPAVCLASSN